ncbi:MAG: TetR family transcriptional regulator, partial [Nonomuraea sp.]|nr:TetR family transcriptional regulator [Nonomuraea sp.]
MTGRPRDPAVDDAIRQAALDLITEQGYKGMSM